MTHTYATMDVSAKTFDEIAGLLKAAGYDHGMHDFGRIIDMHGIGLTRLEPPDKDPLLLADALAVAAGDLEQTLAKLIKADLACIGSDDEVVGDAIRDRLNTLLKTLNAYREARA